jgi:hypothetical protein
VDYADDAERKAAWDKIKKEEKQGKEWQESYLAEAMDEAIGLIGVAKERKGFK